MLGLKNYLAGGLNLLEDTIAAISTPLGEGGIGIVRLSGPAAFDIAKKIFRSKKKEWSAAEGHRLVYGHILDPAGQIVDEVLLGYMKAPHTYTREDIIEINCHGGIVPSKKILELVLSAGARLARPGEFSLRAFLNGRIDLAQAESIIDIIRARTETGLKLAVAQLNGSLSRKILELQDRLLGLLAQVEANIDFPEDDLEAATGQELLRTVGELLEQVEDLIRGAQAGKIYREGIRTIIIGRPNVGKSSLLNALLRENRAIVSDIPGTTRDIIEEMINIGGIPLKIIDTAGLHETENIIEKIGMEKTREMINRADLVLVVLDAGRELVAADLDIIGSVRDKKAVFLVNKDDLAEKKISVEELDVLAAGRPVLWVSAKEETGLDELEEKIFEMVMGGHLSGTDDALVTNTRHKQALEAAQRHLTDAVAELKKKVPVDVAAIDIRAAWEALGEITGNTVTEDLLDRIFADFCIGK
ncbi:tRNA modification GTPase MnmE [Pelotomaculum propionicicum]|uniref:tRNA modification GTPase MnmE n=1 Tax=Pelotomaculum propionicicum TaxID=258475 RepID=A0A4Y7RZJ6_9FIRM|nr:tRNA modification GTPase MnmE [Pelotomaculum propionicicum]